MGTCQSSYHMQFWACMLNYFPLFEIYKHIIQQLILEWFQTWSDQNTENKPVYKLERST